MDAGVMRGILARRFDIKLRAGFVGDEVVQDKIMKVGGEKVVRTEREIDMNQTTAAAAKPAATDPAKKPSMRRPGDPEPELQTQPQP